MIKVASCWFCFVCFSYLYVHLRQDSIQWTQHYWLCLAGSVNSCETCLIKSSIQWFSFIFNELSDAFGAAFLLLFDNTNDYRKVTLGLGKVTFTVECYILVEKGLLWQKHSQDCKDLWSLWINIYFCCGRDKPVAEGTIV